MVRETGTPPTIPVTPAMLMARITSESLAFAPTTTTSNELDPSGNIRDSILTGGASTGDIAFEVSDNLWFEEMLAGVFGNDWATDVLVPATNLYLYLIEKMFPDVPVAASDSFHRFQRIGLRLGRHHDHARARRSPAPRRSVAAR